MAAYGLLTPGTHYKLNTNGPYVESPDGIGDNGPGSLAFEFNCNSGAIVTFQLQIIAPSGTADSCYLFVEGVSPERWTWHTNSGSNWYKIMIQR